MQNESGRLKIHTLIRPSETAERTEDNSNTEKAVCPVKEPQKIKCTEKANRRTRKERRRETGDRLSAGERMVRNTAVACALLLTVMALKNVDQPWSRQAVEGIRQAMTMRVDWDETLGKLSFVRSIVPETALVFFNLSPQNALKKPVSGEISHPYTAGQPWLEYRCGADALVSAAMAGRVSAVGEGMSGDWIVLIVDPNGKETVYGYMADVYVRIGDEVTAGQQIGITSHDVPSRLYFELRENGQSADPTERIY